MGGRRAGGALNQAAELAGAFGDFVDEGEHFTVGFVEQQV